ncbi:bifunctional oligoribonuclease/PAP phosphatase NrnA [Aerococcus sp. 1KP-2016]|jgi:phosphoesterase RecJ-like protein|uniref:DHH family phosphoesterase n=1 Tax=Aerococcus sp. 1KP-2016 TaxID=1981982 RepID=UPI000B98D91C|nr:bifunctional oligoribonuclease/PAP phosphatase NrnA [Aerococcus sp. 1KP-2016]OYQ68311.1 phosphoesterase [Aerococcus sp. 1KP-2016]
MLDKILAAIVEHDVIIIHRHVRPDPDALGSQMGLKAVLEETYPGKEIYAVGLDDDSLAEFGDMDDINDDKYKNALVIVNDSANRPRIDDQRYKKGATLVKIDHHPNEDPYGDYMIVKPEISSTSELWASIVLDEDNALQMNDEAAKCFFLGIVGDTGRFLYDNTTPTTMAIAGELLRYDFPASDLMQESNTQSISQARLQAYVLQNMKLSAQGTVNSVYISQDLLQSLDLTANETYQVVQIPGTIEGVITWVNFIEQPDGKIRARIRSKGPAINHIAAQHDGGGHEKASGANVYSEAEKDELLAQLGEVAIAYRREHFYD